MPIQTGGLNPAMTAQPFQGGYGGLIPSMPSPQFVPQQNYLPQPLGQPGFMPPAIGGYWNQMAQQMAGPMYLPSPPPGMASPLAPPKPPPTYTPGPGAGVPSPVQIPGSALNTLRSRMAGGGAGGGMPLGGRTIQAFGSAPYLGSATTFGIDGAGPSSPFDASGGFPMGSMFGRFGSQVA